ncbi:MAG: site-specific integrase [Bacteroidota bacterium]
MIRSYGVSYLIRSGRESKKNPGMLPVYMRVTINGKRAETALTRFTTEASWDPKSGLEKVKRGKHSELNDYLISSRNKILNFITKHKENGKELSSQMVKEWFLNGGKEHSSFFIIQEFEKHNKMIEDRIGKDYALATHKRYQTTLTHLKAFLKEKYKVDDFSFDQLSVEFIRNFEHYLKAEKNIGHNTTLKYLRHVQKIVNIALENYWIDKDPFAPYKFKFDKTQTIFLTPEELNKIRGLVIKNERLNLVRDLFIFMCFSALSYIDFRNLEKDNCFTDQYGSWIRKNRQKSKTEFWIPVFAETQELIDKYADDPRISDKSYLLPILSNQKLNSYLKEIADLCGINKELSTRVARNTFATTVGPMKGLSLIAIQLICGHSNAQMTDHYTKDWRYTIARDLGLI